MDRALAIIVLSVEPSLLYLLGDPQDPAVVWQKLCDQFQKKTWANKLALRRKLYSLKLKGSESVQNHIKTMMEIFQELSIIGDPIEEEDRVVHLLASLPESFDVLVTALEASVEVPSIETVTERLLHEERKLKERENDIDEGYKCKALFMEKGKQKVYNDHRNGQQRDYNYQKIGQQKDYNYQKNGPRCYHCSRFGHIKRNCPKLRNKYEEERRKFGKEKANNTTETKIKDTDSSDSDYGFMMVSHALLSNSTKKNNWIIDSGATSHMCHDKTMFFNFEVFKEPRSSSWRW